MKNKTTKSGRKAKLDSSSTTGMPSPGSTNGDGASCDMTPARNVPHRRDTSGGNGQKREETQREFSVPAARTKGRGRSSNDALRNPAAPTDNPGEVRAFPDSHIVGDFAGTSNGGNGQAGFDSHPNHAVAAAEIGGEDQATDDPPFKTVLSACLTLSELQRRRTMVERSIFRLNNQSRAYVRRRMGWRLGMPPKELLAINKAAASLVKAIIGGNRRTKTNVPSEPKPELFESCAPTVITYHAAAKVLAPMLEECEAAMIELAKSLPASAWVSSIKGAGMLGLAIIIGEAGPLHQYGNPAKLWKRLGLAPPECYRRSFDGGKTSVLAIPRARRAAIWRTCDYSLLMADNEYRKVYQARRLHEAAQHPELAKKNGGVKMKAHRRASRYAVKRFILHLWRQWRKELGMASGHGSNDNRGPVAAAIPDSTGAEAAHELADSHYAAAVPVPA